MTNYIHDIIELAKQSPKKYCRIHWSTNSKMLAINDTRIPVSKAILVYQDGSRLVKLSMPDNKTSFHILCRANKHMVFMLYNDGHLDCAKLFQLNHPSNANDGSSVGNNNSEVFACILETPTKDTIILSYTNDIYFLQTYDSEYSVTLHGVLTSILNVDNNEKEEHANEELKHQDTLGSLGII